MDSMIRKLYDMELEELGRSGWQDEKLLSEVRKLLEKNKVSIQVEDKLDVRVLIWHLQLLR